MATRNRRISEHDTKRLARIRRGEPMDPAAVRNLVRRGMIHKIASLPPVERREWGKVIARLYYYEETNN